MLFQVRKSCSEDRLEILLKEMSNSNNATRSTMHYQPSTVQAWSLYRPMLDIHDSLNLKILACRYIYKFRHAWINIFTILKDNMSTTILYWNTYDVSLTQTIMATVICQQYLRGTEVEQQ